MLDGAPPAPMATPGWPRVSAVSVLEGPFAIVAIVLAIGGLFKLRDPAPTGSMFAALGLPASPLIVRLVGLIELAVGTLAFLVGGRLLAAAVAVGYLVFAGVTVLLVRRSEAGVSCGCFGRLSAPPSLVHVGVNVIAAALAIAAVVVDVPGFVSVRADLPAAGVPQALTIGVGAWLLVAVLTVLPDVLDATRRGPRPPAIREFEVISHP